MKMQGSHKLSNFTARWRLYVWLEISFIALGMFVGVYFAFSQLMVAFAFGLGSLILLTLLKKPWQITMGSVSTYLDRHQSVLEDSTSLLLTPTENLSGIAQLQRTRVENTLIGLLGRVQPDTKVKQSVAIAFLFVMLGWGMGYFFAENSFGLTSETPAAETITFIATDSINKVKDPPKISSQLVTVRYPTYANTSAYTTDKMDIRALIGSTITWQLSFSGSGVDSVFIESSGIKRSMRPSEEGYIGTAKVTQSGFYNFRFVDTSGRSYASQLYAMEAIEDEAPSVEINGIDQYTSFEPTDVSKELNFTATISDDYGIADAYIIATVTKGEGESVKFREEKLEFNSNLQSGSQKARLEKNLSLDALQMQAGEELYFYVETIDFKQPAPNKSRSETYFAVINDTTQYGEGLEGGMAADLMPDYFRSQRQLIIDTEKLISEKGKITTSQFNSTSNELGFDQKSLRLKYGQFMGDEADSALDIDHDHEHEDSNEASEEDPLAEYTHDHDGDNEHNLVPEEEVEEDDKNPLSEFIHDHGDPEAATLFTNTLKGKLRQAMNYMWDAELYLRLYKPKNSLPHQYKALKLIQDIKNSARIYVHRIGFDPPPVKESARLTGDLDEVSGYRKSSDIAEEQTNQHIRKATARLEELLEAIGSITNEDRVLFKAAGDELSAKAIENPIAFLPELQALKWLSEERPPSVDIIQTAQKGLLKAIPESPNNEGIQQQFYDPLDELLLKELQIND